jgi:probable F420-dependent oxidoreductase
MRPFRFGVIVRRAESRAHWADKARRIEDLGYATFLVPDHLAGLLAPMPALIAAAQATKRLRIGTMVLNNDLRHPVLVAREAATVDLLTDGRLELGVGAGYMKAEYEQTGLPFDPGRFRVERLAEAVDLMKRLFTGVPITFTGHYYQVTAHAIHPLPVQHPRPPILIGGNGPRLLTLAARQADIVGLTGITFGRGGTEPDLSGWRTTGVDERLQLLRTAAGDRFHALELSALVQRVLVREDRRQAAEELSRQWNQLSPEEILRAPYALIGTAEGMTENLLARRERWGISYWVIHESFVDDFAPVVARLADK